MATTLSASTPTALADTATKAQGLLGNLWATANDPADNGGLDGAFADMLSQSDAKPARTPTANPVAPAGSATTTASATSAGDGSATDKNRALSLLKKLNGLSVSLRQSLTVLHQQAATLKSPAAAAKGTASANTGAPLPANPAPDVVDNEPAAIKTTSTVGQNSSAAPAAATSSATDQTAEADTQTAAGDKTPSLSDLINQLLMLTQLVTQMTQTAQATSGAETSPSAAGDATAIDTPYLASLGKDIQSLTHSIDEVIANLNGAAPNALLTPALAQTADAVATPALAQLMNLVQQNAQRISAQLQNLTASASGAAASRAAKPATLDVPGAPAASFSSAAPALDRQLKTGLSALQTEPKTATAAPAIPVSDSLVATSPARIVPGNTAATGDAAKTAAAGSGHSAAMLTLASADTATNAVNPPPAFVAFAAASAVAGGEGEDLESDNQSGGSQTDLAAARTVNAETGSTNAQASGPYAFASQLSAFRAANGGTGGLPSAVDQVVLQLNRSVKDGQNQMSLQLSPGDLGKITVKLDIASDGKVQGTVTADNPKTLDMLQKDSRSLERALQDAGLSADPGSLQFSLGGQGQNQNAYQTAGKNQRADGAADGTQSATETSLVSDLAAMSDIYYVTPGGVNIRV